MALYEIFRQRSLNTLYLDKMPKPLWKLSVKEYKEM
jgi:hypothetical protein